MSYLDKDAVTFSGTVRDNIDPDFKFKDKDIIGILKEINSFEIIKDWVNTKNKKKNRKRKKWIRETNLKSNRSKGFASTDVKHSSKKVRTSNRLT